MAAVMCSVWPEVLARDVESQLRPLTNYLMRLGLEVSHLMVLLTISRVTSGYCCCAMHHRVVT